MGHFSKAYYDDFDNEVYNLNAKELVCSHHIKDKFISNFIFKNGVKSKCQYCNKSRMVVELSEVLKLIVIGINCLFEDANESRYYNKDGEHGFDGETMDFYDLYYNDKLGLEITNVKLFEDIYKYLKNEIIYCSGDEYGGESDYLKGLWNYFKEIVKHKARFVFHHEQTFSNHFYDNPAGILNKVQNSINDLNLFRKVSKKEKLYRCVQHGKKNDVRSNGKRIASNPDKNCKTNNRMSPAGISMFYCSPHEDVCINEVVNFQDRNNPFYTSAYFTSKRKLKLVDLTELPEIPSIFDRDKNRYIETLSFLNEFIKDLSMAIKQGDEIIDYVPTQIVTEYIRYNPELKVDGIVYFSSKDPQRKNYVLFKDHNQSLDDLTFNETSVITNHI